MSKNFHTEIRELDEADLDRVTGGLHASTKAFVNEVLNEIKQWAADPLKDVCPRTKC